VLDVGGWSAPRSGRFTPKFETKFPFYRRLGETQGRSDGLQTQKNILSLFEDSVEFYQKLLNVSSKARYVQQNVQEVSNILVYTLAI
jgi:hypothetical protein